MASSDDGQPAVKRQRVAQACNACRRKKSRCNGARPACSSCTELRLQCEYLNDAEYGSYLVNEHITELVHRMTQLERRLANSEANRIRDQQSQHLLPPHGHPSASSDTVYDESPAVERSPHNTSTDGLAHYVPTGVANPGYFGPSSNIALMRDISDAARHILEPLRQRVFALRATDSAQRQAVASDTPTQHRDQGDRNPSNLDSVNNVLAISPPESPRPSRLLDGSPLSDVDAYALPTETRTQELLDRYFGDTGALYPYVFHNEFLKTYNAWRHRRRTVSPTWIALLNAILALAVHTTWSTDAQDSAALEERHQESALYYRRATQLCPPETFEHTTVEAVQCLTLMAQYLQGTSTSVRTWVIHGLAVKAALQLGLHSGAASARHNTVERERRKRAWYGCVIVDRLLSMTFGRPSIIPQEYIKLPLLEYLPLVDFSPSNSAGPLDRDPESPSALSIDFFNATITLYQITAQVLAELFDNNIECEQLEFKTADMTDLSCKMLHLDRELQRWRKGLRQQLQLIPVGQGARMFNDVGDRLQEKFRVVLTLRYHNLNILTHRPILARALTGTKPNEGSDNSYMTPSTSAVFLSTLDSGLRSATLVIELVHGILHAKSSQRLLLGASWFTLYYTFNAALVVFASVLLPKGVCESLEAMSSPLKSLRDKQACIRLAAEAVEQLYTSERRGHKCAQVLRRLEVLVGHMITGVPSTSTSHPAEPLRPQQPPRMLPVPNPDFLLSAEQSLNHMSAVWSPDSGSDAQLPILDDWHSINLDAVLGYDPMFQSDRMYGAM